MPKRTNPFQRLIHLIEAQLAPEGATIGQSVMMPNRAGSKPTEVDNLVTLRGNPPFRVGIECQNEGRPATVEWIRELHGKYQLLDVDRVVAVARRGFTADAKKEAALFGITPLTIDEAEAFDWAHRLRELDKFVVVNAMYEHIGTEVEISSSTPEPPIGFPDDAGRIFITVPRKPGAGRGESIFTLTQIISKLLDNPRADEMLVRHTERHANHEGRFGMLFPNGSAIFASDGKRFGLRKLMLRMRRVAETTEIQMRHGGYAGAAVAVGSGGDKGSINVAFVQLEGQPIQGKLRIPDATGEKVFDLPDMTPRIPRGDETGYQAAPGAGGTDSTVRE